jgi:hypothetical protein
MRELKEEMHEKITIWELLTVSAYGFAVHDNKWPGETCFLKLQYTQNTKSKALAFYVIMSQ